MMRATLLFLLAIGLWNCTDITELKTDFKTPELVVEAWLTDEAKPQTITLTLSQDYYANRLPTSVEDADVVVCRNGDPADCLIFEYQDSGRYVWTPLAGEVIGKVGDEFTLGIRTAGIDHVSQTTMRRVPAIDSIAVQFEEKRLGLDEGLYAQLYARDFAGPGDAYLIRSTVNDTLLNRPSEINLAFDATFDAGSGTDGIPFIFPIRFSINKTDEENGFVPLLAGDSIRVDIWSLSPEAFFFLSVARDQIQNGDNGIFQVPVANAPGNVLEVVTGEPVLGMFNVAAVSTATKIVEQ